MFIKKKKGKNDVIKSYYTTSRAERVEASKVIGKSHIFFFFLFGVPPVTKYLLFV